MTENEELVARAVEAFNRGGPEAALDLFHPDVEWNATSHWPEDPVYHGHEGLKKLGARWTEMFDDYRLDVDSTDDLGDRVLALGRQSGRARGSGIQLSQELGFIFHVRDGLFRRVDTFAAWDEAEAAAREP